MRLEKTTVRYKLIILIRFIFESEFQDIELKIVGKRAEWWDDDGLTQYCKKRVNEHKNVRKSNCL